LSFLLCGFSLDGCWFYTQEEEPTGEKELQVDILGVIYIGIAAILGALNFLLWRKPKTNEPAEPRVQGP
jgi:hypothetical protein